MYIRLLKLPAALIAACRELPFEFKYSPIKAEIPAQIGLDSLVPATAYQAPPTTIPTLDDVLPFMETSGTERFVEFEDNKLDTIFPTV